MANTPRSGKGWRGDREGHRRAGRKGGMATAKTHDETFYSQIGSIGGRSQGRNSYQGNLVNNRNKQSFSTNKIRKVG